MLAAGSSEMVPRVCLSVVVVSVYLCAGSVSGADDLQSLLDKVERQVNSWHSSSRWRNSRHRYVPPSVVEPLSIDPPDPPPPPKPKTPHPNEREVEALWQRLMTGYQSDQSARSTMTGFQSEQPMRSLWEIKQQMATKDGVEQLRERGPERAFDNTAKGSILDEAHEHMSAMFLSNFTCSTPVPRLVRVFDVYPSTSSDYLPHVVALNKCSDDTGCCMSASATCTASKTQTVSRAFMVYGLSGSVPKRLQFVEDVECHCVQRSTVQRSSCGAESHAVLNDDSGSEEALGRVHRPHSSNGGSRSSTHHRRKSCRCPSEFVARHHHDGRCKCDCPGGAKKCLRLQRGKTYLPERENRCIIQGQCDPPHCAFGEYIKHRGRCPRRHEPNLGFLNYI